MKFYFKLYLVIPIHHVDVGCQNIQREFTKAFHRIIAPAEKYTIFKNKSKRKLTMDNTTMLGLLLHLGVKFGRILRMPI